MNSFKLMTGLLPNNVSRKPQINLVNCISLAVRQDKNITKRARIAEYVIKAK